MPLSSCGYYGRMSKVILGEYIFDTSVNLLFTGEKELEAEPKVLELLAYLYLHHDRYISLQELHEQVWAGRVVSDTAVRGTIKKLRNLLGDIDIAEPKYIKSLSKRGYKLICDVCTYEDKHISSITNLPVNEVDHAVWGVSGSYAAVLERPKIATRSLLKVLSLLSLGAFMLLWYLFEYRPQQQRAFYEDKVLSSQLISTLGGEKQGLALSPDGAYLAFIGRQNQSDPWQIYLMHRQTRNLHRVYIDIQQPSTIQFYDDRTLFVVDEVFGRSGVYRIELDQEFKVRQQERILNLPIITGFSAGDKPNEWLVSGFQAENKSGILYKWDVALNTLERLVAFSSPLDHIYNAVLSPDGRWLVKAQLLNGRAYNLTIQQENQKFYSKNTSGLIKKMLWLDMERLLVLDQQYLSVINMADNSERVLLDAKNSGLSDVVFDPVEQRLLGLYQTVTVERVFRELDLKQDTPFERVINAPAGSRLLNYTEHGNQFLAVVKDQDGYNLLLLDQFSGNQQMLYRSEEALEPLDYHFERGILLLKVGEKLLLVTPSTGYVQIVTNSQTLLEHHASFSIDGQRVYFGQQVGGVWELHQFDRISQQRSLMARGYLSARETDDSFIAVTANGELKQLDQNFAVVRSLDHILNTQLISRWYVKDQRVIWSDFDFITTTINQFDLESGSFQQFSFPYEMLLPRFSLNHDASRMLVYGLGESNTEIRVSEQLSLPAHNQ